MASLRAHQPTNHQDQSTRKAPTHELREIARWGWSGGYEATATRIARDFDCVGLDYNAFYPGETRIEALENLLNAPEQPAEYQLFFYHSDHLGSSSFITDINGDATQHLQYLPFGEDFVHQQNTAAYYTPYTFSGKERDVETNLSYFGARYYESSLSIWLSVDPLSDKYPSLSAYNYCAFNPVMLVDPDGEEPTPTEAARIAAHVYGDRSDKILSGGWRVSTRNFGVQLQNSTGLKSAVYERVVDGKVTEYVYATAGTENWQDWKENGKQPLGMSDQYQSASQNAKIISKALGETELSFVGHSLGGGQAALNSLVTDGDGLGRKAFTFNASGVSDLTKIFEGNWKTRSKSESKIEAYIMLTDPLNLGQNSIPSMPNINGNRHYLLPMNLSSLYDGHSINSILTSFGINPENF